MAQPRAPGRTPTAAAAAVLARLRLWLGKDFVPLGSGSENKAFGTITDQKLRGLGLKLEAFALTFRDLSRHLYQTHMGMAR